MPLPVDVGEAIVAYLRDGRASSSRHLFVSTQPPHRPFTSSAVVNRVLREAFEKTGLKPPQRNVRIHLLRHYIDWITMSCNPARFWLCRHVSTLMAT